MLSGQDDVDHWTELSVWDAVLHNIRIVLSTYQVLYDALAHAFVKMDELALLIFDEGMLREQVMFAVIDQHTAHHCTLKHPANRIMSNFYIPETRKGGENLPKVLGLSASPVMKADATEKALE